MRNAFLFPGQGAQSVGMGKEFAEAFSVAREVFEQADDILGRSLSRIVFEGPEGELTQTRNSQAALYVTSMATLAVLREQFPDLQPAVCSGHSLGEYSAVTASGRLSFEECLPLVQARGTYMNEACEITEGAMAAILGLSADDVESLRSDGLWIANYNCPGQVVISGTKKAVARASELAKEKGARRALLLQVHGAFHSALMQGAEERLANDLKDAPLKESGVELVMNVPGDFVSDLEEVRSNMMRQVTRSVRWEQGMRAMEAKGVDRYFEIGCGKTLAGLNKRIGTEGPTLSINGVADLEKLGELHATK